MIYKLKKYKVWDKKYPRPYYKFNNKIFHNMKDFYTYLKTNNLVSIIK